METFKDQYNRYNTNAVKFTLREKLFDTKDVLPMWVADMDIPSPSFVLDDIKRRLSHPVLGYESFPRSAKTAQKNWLKNNHDLSIKEEDIVYTHSVVTSINVAINAYTKKGDEVIIQPPVYPPFFNTITNNKRKIISNTLKKNDGGHYSFDLKDLKNKITKKTKLLILCSPHNPVGRVWKKEELKELCKICLKNNILIFSDEIHSDLVFSPSKHTPTLSINDKIKDITITAYGVGKTFNLAGIATSTVVIPNKKLRDKFEIEAEKFHLAQGNILGHIAFESAYQNGQKYKEDALELFKTNIKKLDNLLKKHNYIIKFSKPEGTYLVWLDCSGMKLSDKKLKEFFIKDAKLGLARGISFGKVGSKYMRINIAVPTLTMNEALRRLDIALKEFRK